MFDTLELKVRVDLKELSSRDLRKRRVQINWQQKIERRKLRAEKLRAKNRERQFETNELRAIN